MLFIKKRIFLIFIIFSIIFFIVISLYSRNLPGHLQDTLAVFEGFEHIPEFKKIATLIHIAIDSQVIKENYNKDALAYNFSDLSKDSLYGFSCGNHRWFGHWGFTGSIPFNSPFFKDCFETNIKNGNIKPEDVPKIKRKIVEEWKKRVNKIIEEIQHELGLTKKQAKFLGALLYDTHLLGDYHSNNATIKYLKDVEMIEKDIIKNLEQLLGKNNELVSYLKEELKKAKNIKDPAARAKRILKILKKSNLGTVIKEKIPKLATVKYMKPIGKNFVMIVNKRCRESGKRILKSIYEIFENPKIITKNAKTYVKNVLAEEGNALLPSVITPTGALIVFSKVGGIVFITESAYPVYRYFKGTDSKGDLYLELEDAALKSTFLSGSMFLYTLVCSTPTGWVIGGISILGYFIVDKGVRLWREDKNKKFLTIDDLKMFGFDSKSILDLKIKSNLDIKPKDNLKIKDNSNLHINTDKNNLTIKEKKSLFNF